MIPFWPDTFWPIVYAVALAGVCIFACCRDRQMMPVAVVMMANWLATRAVSHMGWDSSVEAAADLASAAVLLFLYKNRELVILPASALFAIMVGFSAAHDWGIIGLDTLWAWSDALAYGQLLLIAGGAAAGGKHRRRHLAADRRNRIGGLDWFVATRLQDPPTS